MTRNYANVLVIVSSIACYLKDLRTEVIEDTSKINEGSGTHAGGILALVEIAANTTNR